MNAPLCRAQAHMCMQYKKKIKETKIIWAQLFAALCQLIATVAIVGASSSCSVIKDSYICNMPLLHAALCDTCAQKCVEWRLMSGSAFDFLPLRKSAAEFAVCALFWKALECEIGTLCAFSCCRIFCRCVPPGNKLKHICRDICKGSSLLRFCCF